MAKYFYKIYCKHNDITIYKFDDNGQITCFNSTSSRIALKQTKINTNISSEWFESQGFKAANERKINKLINGTLKQKLNSKLGKCEARIKRAISRKEFLQSQIETLKNEPFQI